VPPEAAGETAWNRNTLPVLTVACPASVDRMVPVVPSMESEQVAPDGSTAMAVVLLGTRFAPAPLTATNDTWQPGVTVCGTTTSIWFRPG
jgi:hypothetical protein